MINHFHPLTLPAQQKFHQKIDFLLCLGVHLNLPL